MQQESPESPESPIESPIESKIQSIQSIQSTIDSPIVSPIDSPNSSLQTNPIINQDNVIHPTTETISLIPSNHPLLISCLKKINQFANSDLSNLITSRLQLKESIHITSVNDCWNILSIALNQEKCKLITLDSIQKLVSFHLLNGEPIISKDSIPFIHEISHICSQVSQDSSNDQIQLQQLKTIISLITTPINQQDDHPNCQVHLKDLSNCIQFMFNLAATTKSNINKTTARGSLTQICNQLLSRYEMAGEPTQLPQDLYHATKQEYSALLEKDVHEMFALLCKLAGPESNLIIKTISLEIILSLLRNSGPRFQSDPEIISLISNQLCPALSSNISTDVHLFELGLSVFLTLIAGWRSLLKRQVEVLLDTMYMQVLDMPHSTPQQKIIILQALLKIIQDSQTLADLYLNYDCDLEMTSLYERILTSLARLVQQKEDEVYILALQCMIALVESLVEWNDPREDKPVILQDKIVLPGKNPLRSVSMDVQRLNQPVVIQESTSQPVENVTKKLHLRESARLFNEKPKKGLKSFQSQGFCSEIPSEIVTFLKKQPGLTKTAIGELLGEGDSEMIKIMHAWIDSLNFQGMDFVNALRSLLQTFRLPGEAQKIDRIMEKFADRYCEGNPEVFVNADTAYTLAYSCIMLNVDQHSTKVKNKMDLQAFIKNNRGINAGQDLPESLLTQVFQDISTNEIILEEEHENLPKNQVDDKIETYQREMIHLEKKTQALMKQNQPHEPLNSLPFQKATVSELASFMYSFAAWTLLATFSLLFEEEGSKEDLLYGLQDTSLFELHQRDILSGRIVRNLEFTIVDLCLRGFAGCIRLSCMNKLETQRIALIGSLEKMTNLTKIVEIKPRNVKALKTLIIMADELGEYLDEDWLNVHRVISKMEQMQLIKGNPDALQHLLPKPNGIFGFLSNNLEQVLSLQPLMEQFSSQSMLVSIDRLYTGSVELSGNAVQYFFKTLCKVSLEEINQQKPRMYSLGKVVECATYNFSRIRYEFAGIWKVLQPLFDTLGCSKDQQVANFAVDSLRQLSVKFLERDELSHYTTQSEVLKSFEHVFKHGQKETRDLVIQSIQQLIAARSKNIRSGWKNVLNLVAKASHDSSLNKQALDIAKVIEQEGLESIIAGNVFGEYVNCLKEFVDAKVPGSIALLKDSGQKLIKLKDFGKQTTDEEFYLEWFPILSAFSRIVIDSHENVKSEAMEALFSTLKSFGNLFTNQQWRNIRRSVMWPIFEGFQSLEDVKTDKLSKEGKWQSSFVSKGPISTQDANLWIQGLKDLVDLTNCLFGNLPEPLELLGGTLELVVNMLGSRNENLASVGATQLGLVLKKNLIHFSDVDGAWQVVTDALERAFVTSTPTELMTWNHDVSIQHEPSRASGITMDNKLDFDLVVLRAAVHLEVLGIARDVALTMVTEVSEPPSAPEETKEAADVSEVGEVGQVPESQRDVIILATLDKEIRERWLALFYQSFAFARKFNNDLPRRQAIFKQGYVPQLPNLSKQETVGFAAWCRIMFNCYAANGDEILTIKENVLLDTPRIQESLMSMLVKECELVLEKFLSLATDGKKHSRDLNQWAPVVGMIYNELCNVLGNNPSIKKELVRFFKLAIKILVVDSQEVRGPLQKFMDRVAENFLDLTSR